MIVVANAVMEVASPWIRLMIHAGTIKTASVMITRDMKRPTIL